MSSFQINYDPRSNTNSQEQNMYLENCTFSDCDHNSAYEHEYNRERNNHNYQAGNSKNYGQQTYNGDSACCSYVTDIECDNINRLPTNWSRQNTFHNHQELLNNKLQRPACTQQHCGADISFKQNVMRGELGNNRSAAPAMADALTQKRPTIIRNARQNSQQEAVKNLKGREINQASTSDKFRKNKEFERVRFAGEKREEMNTTEATATFALERDIRSSLASGPYSEGGTSKMCFPIAIQSANSYEQPLQDREPQLFQPMMNCRDKMRQVEPINVYDHYGVLHEQQPHVQSHEIDYRSLDYRSQGFTATSYPMYPSQQKFDYSVKHEGETPYIWNKQTEANQRKVSHEQYYMKPPPVALDDLSDDERERMRVKRERNRVAAAKCRNRRRELLERLEKETEQLERDQEVLRENVKRLQAHKRDLGNLLEEHEPKCKNKPVDCELNIAQRKTKD